MAKKSFRITESDFLLANRKAAREEEISNFGKQIFFRTTKQKSKKVYDRKRLKKADINNLDGLPFHIEEDQLLIAENPNDFNLSCIISENGLYLQRFLKQFSQ